MQVGWVKIGNCRQITGYISKMVKDRRTGSIKVEQEVHELYQMETLLMTLSDL